MKCPHCGEEFAEESCPACHGGLPAGSRYCCWCGEALGTAGSAENREPSAADDQDEPADFADRILCSDGSCIGVVGPDGRCKECGKPYTPEAEEG